MTRIFLIFTMFKLFASEISENRFPEDKRYGRGLSRREFCLGCSERLVYLRCYRRKKKRAFFESTGRRWKIML